MKPKRDLAAYGLIAGLAVLLFYPALAWLLRSWLNNPYYTHGFLVPPLAGGLAWRQWKHVSGEPRQGNLAGLPLILASLGGALWAMRWQNYAVACLILPAMLAGILLYMEGWGRLRHWLFPLLFLLFMVPLPLVDRASPGFEAFTARWATEIARLAGIPAVPRGGEIALPGTALVVGAPCSGLRSLVAMITAEVGWVYVVEGRAVAKAALLAAVVPVAALSNVLRVAILLGVATSLGQKAALAFHEGSSLVLFMLALGLLLIISKVLGCSRVRDDIF